jgi:hypothetical protein
MPQVWGFGHVAGPGQHAPHGQGVRYDHMVTAPFWFLFLLSGVLPAVWLLDRTRLRQRRRAAAGLCPA